MANASKKVTPMWAVCDGGRSVIITELAKSLAEIERDRYEHEEADDHTHHRGPFRIVAGVFVPFPPTEAMVEVGAKTLCALNHAEMPGRYPAWDTLSEHGKNDWRIFARIMLTAVLTPEGA